MTSDPLSIKSTFLNKTILLTGATGFLGKTLLGMMLLRLSDIKNIYILIRENRDKTIKQRFIEEILASPPMLPLYKKYGDDYRNYILNKIKLVNGDISLPDCGIDRDTQKILKKTLNLVINCAGLVDFYPNIDDAFNINVKGALNAAAFSEHCEHASFLHISTCYVAGRGDGIYGEEIKHNISPNGQLLNPSKEFDDVSEEITKLKQKIQKKRKLQLALIQLGQQRAEHWGWDNAYCYSKALAEQLLVSQNIKRFSIIRPSIIESALHFPVPGWNIGLNTCAPLCYSVRKYPYIIAKKNHRLDVVPIDFVCNSIIIISHALLQNQSQLVYQLASSVRNPLILNQLAKIVTQWNKENIFSNKSSVKNLLVNRYRSIRCISPKHILAPANITHWIGKFEKMTNKIPVLKSQTKKVNYFLKKIKNELGKINKMYQVFKPFTYDNNYRFISNAIYEHTILEPEFNFDLLKLNWKEYWLNHHMPGMNKWIFPMYENKKINFKQFDCVLDENTAKTLLEIR